MIYNFLLPLHILIALSSIFFTSYGLFKPSLSKLNTSYGLLGLTLLTGTILVLLKPQHLTVTCIEGLVYVALMLIGLLFTKKRLAQQKI